MAGNASSQVKTLLKQLNIPADIIRRTVICFYEAEINVVAHAYQGKASIEILHGIITMSFNDDGPGIPDINVAMTEGFSTATDKVREMGFGAGMGLPNIKRNSDELHVHSVVGQGTTLKIINHIPLT